MLISHTVKLALLHACDPGWRLVLDSNKFVIATSGVQAKKKNSITKYSSRHSGRV